VRSNEIVNTGHST